MQPVVLDEEGVARFQDNPIVRYLVDWAQAKGMGLNELMMLSQHTGWKRADWEQLAQLIGYSVGGFGELTYVRDATYERAVVKKERALKGKG